MAHSLAKTLGTVFEPWYLCIYHLLCMEDGRYRSLAEFYSESSEMSNILSKKERRRRKREERGKEEGINQYYKYK